MDTKTKLKHHILRTLRGIWHCRNCPCKIEEKTFTHWPKSCIEFENFYKKRTWSWPTGVNVSEMIGYQMIEEPEFFLMTLMGMKEWGD